jgi:hypothetical protein
LIGEGLSWEFLPNWLGLAIPVIGGFPPIPGYKSRFTFLLSVVGADCMVEGQINHECPRAACHWR